MKVQLTIEQFPMGMLGALREQLKTYPKCDIRPNGPDVEISDEAEMAECLEIVKIIEVYNKIAIQKARSHQ